MAENFFRVGAFDEEHASLQRVQCLAQPSGTDNRHYGVLSLAVKTSKVRENEKKAEMKGKDGENLATVQSSRSSSSATRKGSASTVQTSSSSNAENLATVHSSSSSSFAIRKGSSGGYTIASQDKSVVSANAGNAWSAPLLQHTYEDNLRSYFYSKCPSRRRPFYHDAINQQECQHST